MVETLDIGCGDRPRGTVNIDYKLKDSPDLYSRDLNPHACGNFVCADAHHLPFRKNVFQKVVCYHALEHLDEPLQAVKEMVRVANGTINIIVPCRFHEQIQNVFLLQRKKWAKERHKHFFDKTQLRIIIARAHAYGSVKYRYKFKDALNNFRLYRLSFLQFILYGLLETLLPPSPSELFVEIKA